MAYLFTDLDNTLVYSHRHETNLKRVWIEKLNGKDQSYMTYDSYNFFSKQNMVTVIPVTTRNFVQYSRLTALAEKMKWEKALICNGAILLINNQEDEEWTSESKEISKNDIPSIKRLYSIALKIAGEDAVVNVCDLMFYVKAFDSDKVFSVLSYTADEHIIVLKDSRKVYCIPASLNKGKAIERFVLRFGKQFSISAGDSFFDVPMFSKTDVNIHPMHLETEGISGILCEGFLSDAICRELIMLYKEDILSG